VTEAPLSTSIQEAIRTGRKIEAIKLLRKERGIGMKEAKEIIDQEITGYRASNPGAFSDSAPSGRGLVLTFIALVAIALYYFAMRQ